VIESKREDHVPDLGWKEEERRSRCVEVSASKKGALVLVKARPSKIDSHRIELLFALGLLRSRFGRRHNGASVFLLLLGKRHAGLDDSIG